MDLLAKPVAVIGGAGFIGLHVVRELRQRGADVRIIDTFLHGGEAREAAESLDSHRRDVDATWPEVLKPAIAGCGLVINLATVCVRECLSKPVQSASTVSALGCVPAFSSYLAGASRYVYVSSSEVYGDAEGKPLCEDRLCNPKTVYGAAKLAGEHYAAAVHHQHGLDTIIVRPFNAYGPGCHIYGSAGEAIPRFISQAKQHGVVRLHGDGSQTRDFTFVVDVARGIVEAALSEAAVNIGPINIASGVERHISDVAHTIADRFGASVIYGEPRPCDLRQQLGCLEYAKELFGWSPNVQWGDGIELTLSDVLARLDNNKVVPEITWT